MFICSFLGISGICKIKKHVEMGQSLIFLCKGINYAIKTETSSYTSANGGNSFDNFGKAL